MNIQFGDNWCRLFTLVTALLSLSVNAALQVVSLPDPSLSPPSGGGGDSVAAILGANGRYVAFASTANNLVPSIDTARTSGVSPQAINVFLRDRVAGTTSLISVNPAGTRGGDGNSFPSGLSSDGRYVLFESTAGNLVDGDTNNVGDVFLRDVVAGATTLVSVSQGGTAGNGVSRSAVMTPDARYVAFVSAASNLVPVDTNGIPDVFVRDLQAGTTVLVSAGACATGLSGMRGASESPEITPDGRFVAFYSTATNLVPGVSSAGEVYVRDLAAGTTAWASTNARSLYPCTYGSSNIISCNFRLSADGRFAAFEACTNALWGYQARGLILRHDLLTGVTDLIHTNADVPGMQFEELQTLDMTPDGRFVVFVARTGPPVATNSVFLWDAQTGQNTLVSANLAGGVSAGMTMSRPSLDPLGRFVVFCSTATDLTTNASAGVFVRVIQLGLTRMVNVDETGAVIDANLAAVPMISDNGRLVAFESHDASRDPVNQVLLRNLAFNTIEMISVRHPDLASLVPNGPSSFSSMGVSSNGQVIAFTSEASNLVRNDTNHFRDVFARDLVHGTNFLVSAATNGAAGSSFSCEPSISGDGRYVAFSSFADNLVPGDTNKSQDVFVRDLQTGATTLVSASTNGGFGNGASYSPQISVDGKYVMFWSRAGNLAPGAFDASIGDVFSRDLQSLTTVALTRLGAVSASMTPDGRQVAVVDTPGSPTGKIYLWDIPSGTTVSTNSVAFGVLFVSLSPDARTIVYSGGSGVMALRAVDVAANTNWMIFSTESPPREPGARFSADSRFLAYAASPTASGASQIYLYDFLNRRNRLVSRRFDLEAAANGVADSPEISPDGRLVAYRSCASNSVPGDFNEVPDVVVYDQLQDATIPVSLNQAGTSVANQRSLKPQFSADGRTLVFQSWASDLVSNDFNHGGDVFALSLSAAPVTDTDGDGMDDQWEMDFFGTLNHDGSGDTDGDGASDFAEYRAGTDPIDAGSVFRAVMGQLLVPGASPTIDWRAAPWRTYRVQFKDDLRHAAWQDLDGPISLLGNSGQIVDPAPATGKRFYRILLNP